MCKPIAFAFDESYRKSFANVFFSNYTPIEMFLAHNVSL